MTIHTVILARSKIAIRAASRSQPASSATATSIPFGFGLADPMFALWLRDARVSGELTRWA
jgi:hypothetical protein